MKRLRKVATGFIKMVGIVCVCGGWMTLHCLAIVSIINLNIKIGGNSKLLPVMMMISAVFGCWMIATKIRIFSGIQ